MVSYRLSNGKEGNITDPEALRCFWTRVYYQRIIEPRGLSLLRYFYPDYGQQEKQKGRLQAKQREAPQR